MYLLENRNLHKEPTGFITKVMTKEGRNEHVNTHKTHLVAFEWRFAVVKTIIVWPIVIVRPLHGKLFKRVII